MNRLSLTRAELEIYLGIEKDPPAPLLKESRSIDTERSEASLSLHPEDAPQDPAIKKPLLSPVMRFPKGA